MVDTGAEWDIKQSNRWQEAFGEGTFYHNQFKIVYNSEIITPEILGNITYGYWGKALGVSDEMLYMGGGVAANSWQFWKIVSSNYGDSPEDRAAIKKGIDLYERTHS